ncbi:MAG: hypothetical protein A2172_01540 [Candidatus Woykebacteria bacterium RBG_13_40_15]|uniref:Glycerophosphoryl diester phosphodiesterase membrane domain-containing protein n=1 Tax=Candidatus Woykebacteria bacterium RBG_13_40_15 TaxID=1802593 RepID=A0A1G1W967_9BACT|nr:MAG: hypothetical protein A2172_01540 [Candidatus Woykebacteria bacterium RBG_13_40_15]
MDFSALIKKSFDIAWHNRVLWLFGFLSGGVTGIGSLNPNSFNIGLPSSEKSTEHTSNVLGAMDPSAISSQTWLIILLVAALVILVLVLIAIFVSNWAAGALVFSILERDKQRPSFSVGARAGFKYWWKFWLLTLTLGLLILAFMLMLALPAILLFISRLQVLAIIYIVLAVIIFVLAIFVISTIGSLIITISQRIIIQKEVGVLESIRLSGGLIKKYLGESLLAYLVAIGLNFAAVFAAMVIFIPIAVVLILMFVIGIAFHLFIWLGLILMIPALLFLFAISGFWQAFNASYWTLVYEHLASKEGW